MSAQKVFTVPVTNMRQEPQKGEKEMAPLQRILHRLVAFVLNFIDLKKVSSICWQEQLLLVFNEVRQLLLHRK